MRLLREVCSFCIFYCENPSQSNTTNDTSLCQCQWETEKRGERERERESPPMLRPRPHAHFKAWHPPYVECHVPVYWESVCVCV